LGRLTKLVLPGQRLASSIPQRLRVFEAFDTWRKGYTVWLSNPPLRGHTTVEQLPQRLGDPVAAHGQLSPPNKAGMLTISMLSGSQRRTSRPDQRQTLFQALHCLLSSVPWGEKEDEDATVSTA
jgi:hypothetical protein